MEDLKQALLKSPALRAINYESPAPVILAVDTLYIAVGYHLAQCDEQKPQVCYYSRFGLITLNKRESHVSQPKLELYGLFHTLQATKLYLIGIRNLVVEVDARSIKGMLNNPDLAPSASMNRWILAILTFHFQLVHVPGTSHGPNGLLRRPAQPGDDPAEDPDDDTEYTTFVRYAQNFFSDDRKLWRKSKDSAHKLVVWPERRLDILRAAHDRLGHHGQYATSQFVRQHRKVLIPPTGALPGGLGMRWYIDSMKMPASNGYRIIVIARCSVSAWPEWRMLRSENDRTLGDFIFQDLICRWGSLVELVTDNGSAFLRAVRDLEKCFNLHHINISPYNPKANGIVEQSHFDT
ncbi:hypothetical protein BN946_scf185038.g9 [Trametes cinnabarina]|uniref:Integrase catalytic domain-containing protein n=1 Tax=Pycnoporus cinnabarinus TaxID=5643 RepID=A0A060SAY9_PYCCI|nr:hypothetical protein BN946_scf185038.g9 [Trametes cinnabarina]